MDNFKKYNIMENTLQTINKNYISLSKKETMRNNYILNQILPCIIKNMKLKDQLFNKLFERIYYGGSYYDGLKVGHPDEYDMDLLLVFRTSVEIITSDLPGYVYAIFSSPIGYENLCQNNSAFLNTSKVLSWIEGILQKVLNDIWERSNQRHSLKSICDHDLNGWISKQGPAFTFHLTGTVDDLEVKMDIDLVTCFYFESRFWPDNFRSNPFPNKGFFIVPKKPRNFDSPLYWRLSFQEQERILLNRKEKLKPALRLLKKMRLTLDHPVDSYYLKTIVLWEIERSPSQFWSDKSLSYIFMRFLNIYKDSLLNRQINYYWNEHLNLIDYFHAATCQNIGRRIERIIKDIDRHIDSPKFVARYILSVSEYYDLFGFIITAATMISSIQDLEDDEINIPPPPPPPDNSQGSCIII